MMRLPFFVVALLATVSNALPNGAPLQSCTTLIPSHPTTNTDDSFGQFVSLPYPRENGFRYVLKLLLKYCCYLIGTCIL